MVYSFKLRISSLWQNHHHHCYYFQKNWSLGRDNYYYFATEEKKRDDTLPSSELAEQAIEYARELEMIV
jgi:26S proteasome regulatory subunit N12